MYPDMPRPTVCFPEIDALDHDQSVASLPPHQQPTPGDRHSDPKEDTCTKEGELFSTKCLRQLSATAADQRVVLCEYPEQSYNVYMYLLSLECALQTQPI